MRVAFLTDFHLDEKRGLPKDFIPTLLTGVGAAKPDLVLLGGDYCGHTVPHLSTPIERNWLIDIVCNLADIAPVVAIRGNHDARGDYDFLRRMKARYGVRYSDEPEIVATDGFVVCLPWLDSAMIKGDWHDGVRRLYGAWLAQAAKELRAVPAVFILGHGAIAGSAVSLGQPSVPTADPVLDPATVCPRWAAAAFWGHYHERQAIPGALCPAWYGGSLTSHQFGEATGRGWTLWDSSATRETRAAALPQDARVMLEIKGGVIIDIKPDVGWWKELLGQDRADGNPIFSVGKPAAKVKLVLQEGEDRSREVASVRAWLEPLFDPLTIDVYARATVRARDGAQEISTAKTVVAKVEAYMDRMQIPPAAERKQAALAMVSQIEGEVFGAGTSEMR